MYTYLITTVQVVVAILRCACLILRHAGRVCLNVMYVVYVVYVMFVMFVMHVVYVVYAVYVVYFVPCRVVSCRLISCPVQYSTFSQE